MATKIISADSHFVEPPSMWGERIESKFRDRAPHTERKTVNGRDAEYFICENITPIPVAGFFGSGKSAEELPEHVKRGFEVAPKSVWDPSERLKEQDRDGVSGEALYTSMGMLLFGLNDGELRNACFHAFNDYAAEYCSYNRNRLLGLGTVELEDIPAGVAELQRCAKLGLRGVLIWGAPPDDKPYGHKDYDPFWAAAQDLDMPLSLHILTGRRGSGVPSRTSCAGICRCRTRYRCPLPTSSSVVCWSAFRGSNSCRPKTTSPGCPISVIAWTMLMTACATSRA